MVRELEFNRHVRRPVADSTLEGEDIVGARTHRVYVSERIKEKRENEGIQ